MARDISLLGKAIKKTLKDTVDDKMLRQFSNLIKDTIYKRTKAGKGLSNDQSDLGRPSLRKLEPLSPAYIKQRLKFKLGDHGSPKRSNLTLTGQLLASMGVKKVGGDYIVEIPKTNRNDTTLTNNQLAAIVSEKRPFFGLAANEYKRIENFVRRTIRQKLRSRRI